jgi:hypothetical protein
MNYYELVEDLQCHNLHLTAEQHACLLDAAEELVRVLKGEFEPGTITC